MREKVESDSHFILFSLDTAETVLEASLCRHHFPGPGTLQCVPNLQQEQIGRSAKGARPICVGKPRIKGLRDCMG